MVSNIFVLYNIFALSLLSMEDDLLCLRDKLTVFCYQGSQGGTKLTF